jgi:hypothetical protein
MSVLTNTIADRLEAFPEAWFHEPGDVFAGEITDLELLDRGFGLYTAVTVVTAPKSSERGGVAIPVGSTRTWHAFGTIPKDELKKLQPRVRDQIAAKDLGVRPGKSYRDWRILVEPKASTVKGSITGGDAADSIRGMQRPDGVSSEDSDEERYADLLEMAAANAAQAGPGGQIPYR